MRLPTDTERIVITGHTGSGKTHEALHQLSQRSYDEKPWIIFDFKGDDIASQIPITAPLELGAPLPNDPGLYAVTCSWQDGEPGGKVDKLLHQICDHRRIGVFIDEGQRLGHRNSGLRTVLTQGRSFEVPLIFLCQRPVFVDTFAFSESEYLQIFFLPHPDDRDRIGEIVPPDKLDFDELRGAGLYHSQLYDVRRNTVTLLGPAPPFDEIYNRILTRLPVYEDAPQPLLPRRARV